MKEGMIMFWMVSQVKKASEVFKKAGTYDDKKFFGVTILDVVRAKTFYAGKAEVNVAGNDHIFCFVTGGSAHVQMQLSTKECESLGLTGLALCLDCNTFAEYVKDQGSIEA
ncbi:malate dehydrogenase, mitochondrial-like isoform X5 [Coffea arabica]|uniref:Malate dehydrogenase, mitochondrial-like isoform X5 n=1 Tax=Coffea arabica TaxID=13443 RepID=A0A6P6WZV1_COFAR|nr:malate dehydrogenase 2, mitochondrial-like isoform X6 [Coffea arabica]